MKDVKLSELLAESSINLDLQATNKEEALTELVSFFPIDKKKQQVLQKMLIKREELGSTGVGRGIAIPHGRTVVVSRLMLAFGLSEKGVSFEAIDKKPVHIFMLIISPPLELSNLYHPTLAKVASLLRDLKLRRRLQKCEKPAEVLEILREVEQG